jgi:hypothetical protein
MKRGSKALEGSSPGGDNMTSAVQRFTSISLDIPLQFEDQTGALQVGHFATKPVVGLHVTHVLDGTTEADPGISSLDLSNAVRNAAACRFLSCAADHEAGLWAYDECGEAAASGAGQEGVAPTS